MNIQENSYQNDILTYLERLVAQKHKFSKTEQQTINETLSKFSSNNSPRIKKCKQLIHQSDSSR